MAKIVDYREIRLTDLVIGKAQVRTINAGQGISELAESIDKIGLLHPIVVCPGDKPGTYEILLGQRRFLAHLELQRQSIRCAVFDEEVTPIEAKVISLSENLVREGLDKRDLIDVCTTLYKHYGSIPAVVDATGLSANAVREYVKYDRLMPELKELVDKGLDVKIAVKAQDAASQLGAPNADEAIMYAKEMAKMSGPNQQKLIEDRRKNPKKSAQEIVEEAKNGDKLVQIIITLSSTIQSGLQMFAKEEGATQADAAAALIGEGLSMKGFLEDVENA